MTADYAIDAERRLIRTRVGGVLTDAELHAFEVRLVSDPRYRHSYAHLMDFTGVTAVELSAAGVRRILDVVPPYTATTGRRVFVAPADVAFGMARMFQLLRGDQAPVLDVVRTVAEGEALLGIPAGPVQH
jgi:hypothetical protein